MRNFTKYQHIGKFWYFFNPIKAGGSKSMHKNIFFIKVWHMFLHPFFRSVALVIKSYGLKLWAILDFFFTHSRLFTALYPTLCVKKNIYKRILQITSYEKSKNFRMIVSKMSPRTKKTTGGRQTPPPPSLYRVNWKFSEIF